MAEPKKRDIGTVYDALKSIEKEANVDFGIGNYTKDQFASKYGSSQGVDQLYTALSSVADEANIDFGLGERDEWNKSFNFGGQPPKKSARPMQPAENYQQAGGGSVYKPSAKVSAPAASSDESARQRANYGIIPNVGKSPTGPVANVPAYQPKTDKEVVGDAFRAAGIDNAAEKVWANAEQRTKAAQESHNSKLWGDYANAGGGKEMRAVFSATAMQSNMADRLTYHDLNRMAEELYNNNPSIKQSAVDALKAKYPQADDAAVNNYAEQYARQKSAQTIYELAVKKNAPKNATEYFFRKVIEGNSIAKLMQMSARMDAGTSGDMVARDVANQRYESQGHKAAGVLGTATSMATDPLTYISGGIGGAATKGATWLGGRVVTDAAMRKFSTSLLGRAAFGAVAGSANLSTYMGTSAALEQMRLGGVTKIDEASGVPFVGGYEASQIGKEYLMGSILGLTTGAIAPLVGNATTMATRAADKTGWKAAFTIAGTGTSAVAEGTIFAVPEWIEYERNIASYADPDSDNYIADESKRVAKQEELRAERGEAMMDAWYDSMGMIMGFKFVGAIKSAPERIRQLKGEPGSKAGFETRLRNMLDMGHDQLDLKKDEKAELDANGYGDLKNLVESYKEYVKSDKSKSRVDVANAAVIEGEALPYDRFVKLMEDGRVSEAARAKMYYYITGNTLPMSTIMGSKFTETTDENGNVIGYIVDSFGANGVITSRHFTDKKSAERELAKIERQAELNSIEIGENFYDSVMDAFRMYDACKTIAGQKGVSANILYEMMKRDPGSFSDMEREWADLISKEYDSLNDITSQNVRQAIYDQYGIDVDKAIAKEPGRRTEAEQKAVEDYAKRLYQYMKQNEGKWDINVDELPLLGNGEDFNFGYNANEQEARDIVTEMQMTHPDDPRMAELSAAKDGVMQRIEDEAGVEDAKKRKEVDVIRHENGNIIKAYVRETNEDGTPKAVYVKSGNIVMSADGKTIDKDASDKSVVVYDPATGETRMMPPTGENGFVSVDAPITPDKVEADIMSEHAARVQEQRDALEGKVSVQEGQAFTMPDGRSGVVTKVVGDNVEVALNDSSVETVSLATMQQMSDKARVDDYMARHPKQTESAEMTDAPSEDAYSPLNGKPSEYTPGMEIVLSDKDGNQVSAVVTDRMRHDGEKLVSDPNGSIVEYSLDGKLHHESVKDLDGKVLGFVEPKKAEPVPVAETQTEEPNVQAEPIPSAESVARKTTAEEEYSALVSDPDLTSEEVSSYIGNKLAEAQKAMSEIEKQKPSMGTDLAAFKAAKAEWSAKMEDAKAEVDKWSQAKALDEASKADADAIAKAEEDARVKEESEKKEAEAKAKAEQERVEEEKRVQDEINKHNEKVKKHGGLFENEFTASLGDGIRRLLDTVGKQIGRCIEFRETLPGGASGLFRPSDNTICISGSLTKKHGEDFVRWTLGHEVTHAIKEASKELYDRYVQMVKDVIGEEEFNRRVSDFEDRYKAHREKVRQEGLKLDDLTEEEVIEEVVADWASNNTIRVDEFAERLLEEAEKVGADPRSVIQKVIDTINKIIESIKDMVGLDKEKKNLEAALEAWKGMYDAAVATHNMEMSDTEILTNDAVIDGSKYSLEYAPKSKADERAEIEAIMKQTGRSEKDAKRWVRSQKSLATLFGNELMREYLDYTSDDTQYFLKKNSDYPQGSIDFNNICKKRIPATLVWQKLQHDNTNRILTAEDLANMIQVLRENGYDVPCSPCFVEDRRQKLGEIADAFIKDAKNGFKKYGEKNPTKAKVAEKIVAALDGYTADELSDILDIDKLITLDGNNRIRKEYPEVYDAFVIYNNARGQQAGRLFVNYAEYKREILDWDDARVKRINDEGGLRIFSTSDFEAHHLLDIIQIVQDCATRGIKIQGYTKVPEFARLMAKTGAKINMSLIPMGVGFHAEDGRVVLDYDPVEGIDVENEDYKSIGKNSPNIGTIIIGINDEHIRHCMNDDNIDFIIPFHTGLPISVRRIKGIDKWVNYKLHQTEKRNGKAVKHSDSVNIYTDVIDAARAAGEPMENKMDFVNKYLQVCKEKGLTPKYAKFLDKDADGNFVYTEGFHKFLVDFKLFDKKGNMLPFEPVVSEFDDALNRRIVDDYVADAKVEQDLTDITEKVRERLNLGGGEKSDDVKFSLSYEESLAGIHNIREEELRKALGLGGLANPSVAVVDVDKNIHDEFGEISLIMPSEKIDSRSGRNLGTWDHDVWTPSYPKVYTRFTNEGAKNFVKLVEESKGDERHKSWLRSTILSSMDSGDEPDLSYFFLTDVKGMDVDVYYRPGFDNRWIYFIKYRSAEQIRKACEKDEFLKSVFQSAIDNYFSNKIHGEHPEWRHVPGESKEEFAKTRELRKEYKSQFLNEDGTYTDSFVNEALNSQKKASKNKGTINHIGTISRCRDIISKSKKIEKEYKNWLGEKLKEIGTEELLRDGYTRNGNAKYVPNTAENASKLMNKNQKKTGNGLGGWGTFVAQMSEHMKSLGDIRKKKGMLGPEDNSEDIALVRGSYNEFPIMINQKSHDLDLWDGTASKVFADILKHGGDIGGYAKSRYGLKFSDEELERINKFYDAFKRMPIKYFETKFDRVVGIDEFSSAVVPNKTSEDIIQALKDNGISVFKYNPKKDGDRERVQKKATSVDGVRFNAADYDEQERKVRMATIFSGGGTEEVGVVGIADIVYAAEWDEKIRGVYQDNHGGVFMFNDVNKITFDDIFELMRGGDIEYLHASPVCKAFSTAHNGKDVTDEEVIRDREFAQSTANNIRWTQVKAFTLENVPQYIGSEPLAIIEKTLAENGYVFDEHIYDSADYGAATSRRRMILRAVKAGNTLPPRPKFVARTNWHERLKDLITDEFLSNATKLTDAEVEEYMSNYKGDNPDSEMFLTLDKQFGKWRTVDMTQVAPTILAGTNGNDSEFIMFKNQDGGYSKAPITSRMLARIQGLPDDYKLPSSYRLAHTVIGNGIPVELTRAVMAPLIRERILKENKREKVSRDIERKYEKLAKDYMGDMSRGTKLESKLQSLFDEYVLNRADENIAPFLAPVMSYKGKDVSKIAHALKGEKRVFVPSEETVQESGVVLRKQTEPGKDMDVFSESEKKQSLKNVKGSKKKNKGSYKIVPCSEKEKMSAISIAASAMAPLVPSNAVLVPMTSRSGRATDTIPLAEAIGRITGAPVLDILRGLERGSMYQAKITGKSHGPEMLGLWVDGEIPSGKRVVFIDNVVHEGNTAAAATRACGGGTTLAYAFAGKKSGAENEQGKTQIYRARINNTIPLKSADVVTYDDNGNVIPLSKRFDPFKDDIRFNAFDYDGEMSPVFNSNAAVAVEKIKQDKATPSQWLAMLQKNGGLKAGEDKWIGLSDWLKSSDKKSLTKDEVLQYIAKNEIRIFDVNYSEDGMPNDVSSIEERDDVSLALDELDLRFKELMDEAYEIGDLTDEDYDDPYQEKAVEYAKNSIFDPSEWDTEKLDDTFIFNGNGVSIKPLADPKDVFEYLELDVPTDNEINETRLSLTTEWLENKREIALVVPSIGKYHGSLPAVHFDDDNTNGRAIAWVRFGETTIEKGADDAYVSDYYKANEEFYNYMELIRKKYGTNFSESLNEEERSRIDELQSACEVAHEKAYSSAREKVLVIDEVQSQRHQDGREKGYYNGAFKKALGFVSSMQDKYGTTIDNDNYRDVLNDEEVKKYESYENEVQNEGNVPDAPFDKNWHELAMKRMLRYAAENGYDKVAWTKGAQQAKRYDMAKVIDSIEQSDMKKYPNTRGIKSVKIEGNDFVAAFSVDEEGNVVKKIVDNGFGLGDIEGKHLSEIVGKELSNKIMSSNGTVTYKGEDIVIGGEGMKAFYDKIIPAFMDKYCKKWGTQVGEVKLDRVEEAGRTMWSVDVTPEMKESVLHDGQVMFSIGNFEEAMDEVGKAKEMAKQDFGSGETSINKKRLPSGFGLVDKLGGWKEGSVNLDMGGGKFDNATEMLREKGVENLVFDPYNRSAEHNRNVAERMRDGGADTTICNNCLNVINTDGARANVILQCAKALKPGGTSYFTIYEGDGSGEGKQSKGDCWQNNRKAADYVDEIKKFYNDVTMSGKLIVAKDPVETDDVSYWNYNGYDDEGGMSFSVGEYDDSQSKLAENARRDVRTYGIKEMLGDGYKDFLKGISVSGALKSSVDGNAGSALLDDPTKDYSELRAEEVGRILGELSEKHFEEFGDDERYLWESTRNAVRDILNERAGGNLPSWFSVADNELRYMMWRDKEGIVRGQEDPIQMAMDIVKRRELGLDDDHDPDGGGNGGGVRYSMFDRFYNIIGDGSFHVEHEVVDMSDYPQVSVSVSNSKNTESVYVRYYNKENGKSITVRFSNHTNNAVEFGDQLDKFASRGDILHRLGLATREFIPSKRKIIATRQVKKKDIESGKYEFADKTIRELYDLPVGTDISQYKGKIAKGSNYLIEGDNVDEYEETRVDRFGRKVKLGDYKYTEDVPLQDRNYFKKWFGDSKVVDDKGNPLVVYHGSKSGEFTVFNDNIKNTNAPKGSFFFFDDDNQSMTYSGENGYVIPCYLYSKNPFVIDARDENWDNINVEGVIPGKSVASTNDIVAYAKSNGYDGVIIKNVLDPGYNEEDTMLGGYPSNEYVVFSPNQIKSIYNENPTDSPDIRFNIGTYEGETDDIWKDQTIGLYEKTTAAALRLEENHKGDLERKNESMKAVSNNLSSLLNAVHMQKDVDKNSAKRIADLARVLMQMGYIEGARKSEVKGILTTIKNSVGKIDIRPSIDRVLDIMLENNIHRAQATLDQMLKIREVKVNSNGIQVQGKLEADGQTFVRAFKEAYKLADQKKIAEDIADALDRMESNDRVIAEQAAIEYDALSLADYWLQNVKACMVEEANIKKMMRDAGRRTTEEREYYETLEDALRKNRCEMLENMQNVNERMASVLRGSIDGAKEFREAEKANIQNIHHYANSDLEGKPFSEFRKKSFTDKLVNFGSSSILSPLCTFEQMLRLIGGKSANGEGYLFNKFMRGCVDAREKEIVGYRSKLDILDKKANELFGVKDWHDLIVKAGRMGKMDVVWRDGGEMIPHKLSVGGLLYIYMVDKMTDGRMKLRAMGIGEEAVNQIAASIDPRLIKLADWIQDEFLVDTRNEYNETHKRVFGAPMASVENYFPLKINDDSRSITADELDVNGDPATISTVTGSIKKRVRNNTALDLLNADALNIVVNHVSEMEHWNAFAEFNRDLNILRTYGRFRNKLMGMHTVYGTGKTLMDHFNSACQLAVGSYVPANRKAELDKAILNMNKLVATAKVSFRLFTALKQTTSIPAFITDVRADHFASSAMQPWKAWRWCMENLPVFSERWNSRMSGDPRLIDTNLDYDMMRNDILRGITKVGMSPNAFVDALSVSIGAYSVYKTRYGQYIKDGYSEDFADRRAKQDATIAFNQSQQSSEGAFVAPVQIDRTVPASMLTLFRNASMGYTRQFHDSFRKFVDTMTRGYKGESIEFMKKMMVRDGLSEEQADGAASRKYARQAFKNPVRAALFGFGLPFVWYMSYVVPYMIFGRNKKEKERMMKETFYQSMLGPLEGLIGGDVYSEAFKMGMVGQFNVDYIKKELPVVSDSYKVLNELANGKNKDAVGDVINLVVQMGLGFNPQTFTDAALAIIDACGNDPKLAKEAAICVFRILQIPQSQIDEIYFDEIGMYGSEISNYTPEQLAQRYAVYKVKRGRLLTYWAWDNDDAIDKKKKLANKKINERIDMIGDEGVNEKYQEYEEIFKEVDEVVKAEKKKSATEFAEFITDFQENDSDRYYIYARFKEEDKILDRLAKMLVGAKSLEESEVLKETIVDAKRIMVDCIGAASEEEFKQNSRELDKLNKQLTERLKDISQN